MDGSERLHIVMVPGFAGFDALGQLEYYAGVTAAYQRWRDRASRPVVLHYFDNLPTAGVATRAERLRAYLAKRIARGEIQQGDRIALVGHSTGGLDIRRLLFSPPVSEEPRVLHLDGAVGTAVSTTQEQILEAVDCLVFLSVPQWGTNIADWTIRHRLLRRAVVNELHYAVEGARLPVVDEALSGLLGQVGRLAREPDLLLAAQDSIRETTAPRADVTARADAQEAGSKLRLWLQHAVDDFGAIDDLAASPRPSSASPAHYTEDDRVEEQALWEAHGIRTLSFATLGRRPFDLPAGRPAEPFALTDPRTWPSHGLLPGAGDAMDVSYLCGYRACAGGPFVYPSDLAAGLREVGDVDTSLYDVECLAGDGPDLGEQIELWDNDGIVNTASMLWPDGARTHLVAADHGDIIGHRELREDVAPTPSRRKYAAYDLLGSGTSFTDAAFDRVWNTVFDFCAGL